MKVRHINVMHEPVGQPRHKVSTRGGFAKMYLDKKHPVHSFKDAIREAFGKKAPHGDAVQIIVYAFFKRPKSITWKTKEMPAIMHVKKPDADNVLKAVLDALNGFAWHDDAQVFFAKVCKYICDGATDPRCNITIIRHVK